MQTSPTKLFSTAWTPMAFRSQATLLVQEYGYFAPDIPLGLNPASFVPPATPIASVDQAHLLDTYVAMNLADWQLSYGKQSLWWGPGRGGRSAACYRTSRVLDMVAGREATPPQIFVKAFLGGLGAWPSPAI